ncbi:MAG: SDR family NAD(P)-dependent oxidoreductase [Woeseiaceae bacterium]|nr:SDR family NAD(P)-dependent oxidoreductase [Woeseiaceae bacterium]
MTGPRTGELLNLDNRTAIVTGASQGIGAAIASRLAAAGARVVVHYRSHRDAADEVVESICAEGGKAVAVPADLARAEEAEALVERAAREFGGPGILVNNAGTFPTGALLDIEPADWQAVQRANVDTAFFCTRSAARRMRDAGAGAIVNIASIEALSPAPDHAHYASAKAAVVMFTRAAAQELGRYSIRVNAVSPGLISRPGIEEGWPGGVARWRARAPLARLGEPDDVANACLFLVSPAARWISGHNLVVDGGISAQTLF